MENGVFIADIHWLRPDEGGRQTPVPMKQKRYGPLVAVDGQRIVGGSAWSLLCYSFEKKSDFETLAYIRYLNDLSHPDNLRVGSAIELFEGARKVAYGSIVGRSEFDFSMN